MAAAGSVLDASALLAYLRKEPGGERVLRAILAGGAVMATVNFGEVAAWFVRNGADETFVRSLRSRLAFPLVPVDDDLAVRAALLEPATRASGLGLGDRTCLALAGRLGVPAVTADRPWAGPAARVGVTLDLIR
jgi:PIN domain nuclease of toxin-antitoxin system